MSLPLCHDTFNLEFFHCFMWSRSWSCLYVRDLTKEWSSVQEDQTGGKIADVFTCFISMGVLTPSLSSCCGKLLGLFIDGCSVAPVWAWLILKWEWDYKGLQEDTVGTYSPLFGLIWQLWIVKLSSSSSSFFSGHQSAFPEMCIEIQCLFNNTWRTVLQHWAAKAVAVHFS